MIRPLFSPSALCMAIEIGGIALSGFLLFRRWRYSFAEAAAYGIMSTAMLLSLMVRIAGMLRLPEIMVPVEAALICAATGILIVHRNRLGESFRILKHFVAEYPLGGLGATLGVLILFAGLVLIASEGNPTAMIPASENGPVSEFLVGRWHSGPVSEVFGLLMYLSIGFSTYSLARRYSWPSTALTVTLVVISMPKLVYLSFSPGGEIVPAAASICSLLVLHRLIEQPNAGDLALLFPAIFFGVKKGPLAWAFPAILSLLAVVLLTRRHGAGSWRSVILRQPSGIGLALLSAFILSGYSGYLAPNPDLFIDSNPAWHPNKDGLIGAAGNLARYFFEIGDPIPPLDDAWRWIIGFRLSDLLQTVYDRFLLPVVENRGAVESFILTRYRHIEVSWFGPFAFLLILPAIAYAAVRGHRRIKAIAVALFGYLYIVTLVIAWKPGNGLFLTPFFTGGGFLVATLLPPWRLSSSTNRLLQLACLTLLAYGISRHPDLRMWFSNR